MMEQLSIRIIGGRMRNLDERVISKSDNNIKDLRMQFPDGLHFVVGDVHGQVSTLKKLMGKIEFNPYLDHVYFVGDYNGGGDVKALLDYMSVYYQEDYNIPGFHMIRGNHERELFPLFPLENLPDIIVIRGKWLVFYIVHAGMVSTVFDLINEDIDKNSGKQVFAYKLEDNTCCYDAPLRQVVWSLRGLYSQHSRRHVWPDEKKLKERNACIIHGHTPYCFFKRTDRFTYGDDNLFWKNQHVWFCSELRSFNVDSNVKGRYENGEMYRGLSCICLNVYDKLVGAHDGLFTTDILYEAENGIFGVKMEYSEWAEENKTIDKILKANPEMKTIGLDGKTLVIR